MKTAVIRGQSERHLTLCPPELNEFLDLDLSVLIPIELLYGVD